MQAAMGAIISEDIKRTEAHMKRLTRIRDGRDLLVRWEAGELSAPTADDFRMMAESMDWKSQQESDTAKARVAFESAVAWSSARATGVERA